MNPNLNHKHSVNSVNSVNYLCKNYEKHRKTKAGICGTVAGTLIV